ncbi:hypothetical protein NHQ30_006799, partial [Ciborinia camelliae]
MDSRAEILDKITMPSKRHTFERKIEFWQREENCGRFALVLEDIDKTIAASRGYRWESPSTILKEDIALRRYRQFTSLYLLQQGFDDVKVMLEEVDATNDHIIFPDDQEELIEYICRYITFCAQNNDGNKKPKLTELIDLSKYMWYWIAESALPVMKETPSRKVYNKRTMEIIKFIDEHGGTDQSVKMRTYIGLRELNKLIEDDLATTNNIEATEQHHVAWLFDYFCRLSLGCLALESDDDKVELAWRNIKIRRGPGEEGFLTGRIIVDIELINLETDHDTNHVYNMTITSPEFNPMLSLPHKLLTMLIRRKLLENYDTIESVMNSRVHDIILKDEAMNQPIFLSANTPESRLNDENGASIWDSYGYIEEDVQADIDENPGLKDFRRYSKDDGFEGEPSTVASHIAVMKALIPQSQKRKASEIYPLSQAIISCTGRQATCIPTGSFCYSLRAYSYTLSLDGTQTHPLDTLEMVHRQDMHAL